MGFMNPDVMCSNLVDILPGATLYHFGILTSSMHMIWMRAVCGRLEERYRYSIEVVYNNFPWPTVSPAQKERIEALASDVIAARDRFPTTSYADLYNPSTMPNDLSIAHRRLDNAVKALYGLRADATDEECILALYRRYSELDE